MNHHTFILLGSNLGDKSGNLTKAKALISRTIGSIITQSSVYKTAPWGIADQPEFFNQVIEVLTHLTPSVLLSQLLEIEKEMGRIRDQTWGSRIIDLDILFYDSLMINEEKLVIPHPQIQNRRFTLEPLVEINPSLTHPVFQKSVKQLLEECKDSLSVERLQA